ncbi:MAG TPA: AAA family ATPase [Firmicutes bacterium]|jgi:uridine kinase|nr:AAA family ATPase [Bacillota bacterium]
MIYIALIRINDLYRTDTDHRSILNRSILNYLHERTSTLAIPSPLKIEVSFPNGSTKAVPAGTKVFDLLTAEQHRQPVPIVGALVNNTLRELTYPVSTDAEIIPIDLTSELGVRIYWRSLNLVLIRAAREIYPGCHVLIEHSLSKGIFGEVIPPNGKYADADSIELIENRMRRIIAADEPIIRVPMSVNDAIALFEADQQPDKARLLKYKKSNIVKVYRCGWFHDYFYGYMVPSTGYLKVFELRHYNTGFILRFPRTESPTAIQTFVPSPQLGKVFGEFERWGRILEVDYLASLNEKIASGKGHEIVRIAEALHEKKMAAIADSISSEKERLRLILIAGPSSSGKTTFAQRLMVQLRVNGLRPVSISVDDYFVNRDRTPKDANGEFDFECLEAIDLDLFNEHLRALIAGKPVQLPRYSFIKGAREKSDRILQITKDQPILIEGIHGLNERLTPSVPKHEKFKIYVSALTQLNMDEHNRIPTTDNRMIRRIVRDHRTRGYSATNTIAIWPSVRRGEERHIFPFQEEADVMFNSALVYELAILKSYVEPLLKQVRPDDPAHVEAKRLLKMLQYFVPMDESEVPLNSILREFIGNSCFYKEQAPLAN